MFLTHIRQFFPLSYPPDAGAGAGPVGSASPTGGGGADSGSRGTGGGNAPGASGEPSYSAITDDTHVQIGDFKGRYGDYQKQFVPVERFNAGVRMLEGEAKKIEDAWSKYYAGEGRKPQQPDPTAQWRDQRGRLKNMSLVDGNTLADQIDQLEKYGMAPIAQVLAQQAATIKRLEEAFKRIDPTVSQLGQDRTNNNFNGWVDGEVIGKLEGIKGLPNGLTVKDVQDDPFLKAATQDVYLSHDQQSWGSSKNVRAMVGERVQQAIAFVRRLDKMAVELADKNRRASFANLTRGGARPAGEAPYQHKKGDELASMLFGAAQGSRT